VEIFQCAKSCRHTHKHKHTNTHTYTNTATPSHLSRLARPMATEQMTTQEARGDFRNLQQIRCEKAAALFILPTASLRTLIIQQRQKCPPARKFIVKPRRLHEISSGARCVRSQETTARIFKNFWRQERTKLTPLKKGMVESTLWSQGCSKVSMLPTQSIPHDPPKRVHRPACPSPVHPPPNSRHNSSGAGRAEEISNFCLEICT